MTEKKGKWASRHRKIEKSGYQAAAKMISFPPWWHGGMISANQEAIWGMSVHRRGKRRRTIGNIGHGSFTYGALRHARQRDCRGGDIRPWTDRQQIGDRIMADRLPLEGIRA